jgi:hypothetical protein
VAAPNQEEGLDLPILFPSQLCNHLSTTGAGYRSTPPTASASRNSATTLVTVTSRRQLLLQSRGYGLFLTVSDFVNPRGSRIAS